ncbi:hypothetical protein SLA2020_165490 [Shorea laevis]
MYAANDGDLPNIASSSSGGLNSGFETVSPASVLHSVSPRSRSSGVLGLLILILLQFSLLNKSCSLGLIAGRVSMHVSHVGLFLGFSCYLFDCVVDVFCLYKGYY